MKHITINRKPVSVSAMEERVLRGVVSDGGVSPLGDYESGAGRTRKNEARHVAREFEVSPVGLTIYWRKQGGLPAKVRAWFRTRPNNQFCVAGDLRRMKSVVRKLNNMDGEGESK